MTSTKKPLPPSAPVAVINDRGAPASTDVVVAVYTDLDNLSRAVQLLVREGQAAAVTAIVGKGCSKHIFGLDCDTAEGLADASVSLSVIGVPEDGIPIYETDLGADRLLLIAHGTPAQVRLTRSLLLGTNHRRVDHHQSSLPPYERSSSTLKDPVKPKRNAKLDTAGVR